MREGLWLGKRAIIAALTAVEATVGSCIVGGVMDNSASPALAVSASKLVAGEQTLANGE